MHNKYSMEKLESNGLSISEVSDSTTGAAKSAIEIYGDLDNMSKRYFGILFKGEFIGFYSSYKKDGEETVFWAVSGNCNFLSSSPNAEQQCIEFVLDEFASYEFPAEYKQIVSGAYTPSEAPTKVA